MRLALLSVFFLLILNSCDKELSTSPPDPPAEHGKILVKSIPRDYQIYLNDKIQGKTTPDSMIFLNEGTYTISLKHPLYVDTTITFNLEKDEQKELIVDCSRHQQFYSELECLTLPKGAEIFINDSSTGFITPTILTNVFPGDIHVSMRKTGCRSYEKDLALVSNTKRTLYSELEDTTIWLYYNSLNSEIPSNYIRHVEFENNTVWVGTFNMGVGRLRNHEWKTYNPLNGYLPAYAVTGLSVTNEHVWVATTKGIAVISFDIPRIFTAENSPLLSDNVSGIFGLNNQEAFIATQYNGITRIFFNNVWETYNTENSSLSSNLIKYVTQSFWYSFAATEYGLHIQRRNVNDWEYYYPDGVIMPSHKYDQVEILPGDPQDVNILFVADNTILGLYENGQLFVNNLTVQIHDIYYGLHDIWAATEIGLFKFDRELHFTESYTKVNSGMVDDEVFSIDVDDKGQLWLGTDHGLARFNYPARQ